MVPRGVRDRRGGAERPRPGPADAGPDASPDTVRERSVGSAVVEVGSAVVDEPTVHRERAAQPDQLTGGPVQRLRGTDVRGVQGLDRRTEPAKQRGPLGGPGGSGPRCLHRTQHGVLAVELGRETRQGVPSVGEPVRRRRQRVVQGGRPRLRRSCAGSPPAQTGCGVHEDRPDRVPDPADDRDLVAERRRTGPDRRAARPHPPRGVGQRVGQRGGQRIGRPRLGPEVITPGEGQARRVESLVCRHRDPHRSTGAHFGCPGPRGTPCVVGVAARSASA